MIFFLNSLFITERYILFTKAVNVLMLSLIITGQKRGLPLAAIRHVLSRGAEGLQMSLIEQFTTGSLDSSYKSKQRRP